MHGISGLWQHICRSVIIARYCRQQELLALLLVESAQARAVPRVARRATMRILSSMARSAEPIQDLTWNAAALRHLQIIAESLPFYSSPELTQSVCIGEHAENLAHNHGSIED